MRKRGCFRGGRHEKEKIGGGLSENSLYPFQNKDVHGADIARAIGVSRPTVCVSLKALEEEGYILMDDAREVHLTEKGLQIAEETYERHNTLC